MIDVDHIFVPVNAHGPPGQAHHMSFVLLIIPVPNPRSANNYRRRLKAIFDFFISLSLELNCDKTVCMLFGKKKEKLQLKRNVIEINSV